MPKYRVTATSYRRSVRTKDDATGDTVRIRTRYSRNDVVDLPADEAERLVLTGGLVPVDEDGEPDDSTQEALGLTATATPGVPAGTPGVAPGATSGQTADEGLRGDADATGDSEAPDGDDVFEDMKYTDLQAAARDRGLSASGSSDDLKARLREYTAGKDDEDDTTS